MINVPQSTVEKPLTAIDYIAALQDCATASEVAQLAQQVPMVVRHDDRFARAVVIKLDAIRESFLRKRA